MGNDSKSAEQYIEAIRESGLSIYDDIEVGDENLWIPLDILEHLLNEGLVGVSLGGFPLRTRSKIVKSKVCKCLGYPVPSSFKKCQPRFLGQQFDTYAQKSINLQIWNEAIEGTRRYVIIKIGSNDVIEKVKVVTGADISILDTTGTLTQKYQARLEPGQEKHELVSASDTERLKSLLMTVPLKSLSNTSPLNDPAVGGVLPIKEVFDRLTVVVGQSFADAGIDQDRNRGAELHKKVCKVLGYTDYYDDGQFPDIKNQLLEIKLQTSPTIDLGLVEPSSVQPIGLARIGGTIVRHCDVRYVIFYANTDGRRVTLTHLFVTTGEDFFSRFRQFKGKVLNKKLQIHLPSDFFA